MGERVILQKGSSVESVPLTITLTTPDGENAAAQDVIITITEVGSGEVFKTVPYTGPVPGKITVPVPVHLHYRVSVNDLHDFKAPGPVEGTARKKTPVEIEFKYTWLRYGYRRTIAEPDPYNRIEYLFDAAGKTPFTMDLSDGTPNYGDWADFIDEVVAPVMLRYDGTEDYELDRSDQTKKADGSPSDISDPGYGGNAMVRFSKWKWVKRYEEGAYQYVIFSNGRYDDSYHAYAHTNDSGEVQDAFYWGIFNGSIPNDRLRSIADQPCKSGSTRQQGAGYATANGTGYYTIYKSSFDYIFDILTLIGKCDDYQKTFGYGCCSASGPIDTGSLKTKGAFWGSSDKISDVKVLFIEGLWGNAENAMAGMVMVNGVIKTKMTGPYNFDGTGYTETGVVPVGNYSPGPATPGGFISEMKLTDESGYVPSVIRGSDSTYYADGFWHWVSTEPMYAIVTGCYASDLYAGRSISLNHRCNDYFFAWDDRISYISP